MDLQNHEKWIKDQFAGRKAHVDSNELWAALEQHVPTKKKRKVGILFWFIGGLMVVGVGLTMLFQTSDVSIDMPENDQSAYVTKEVNFEEEDMALRQKDAISKERNNSNSTNINSVIEPRKSSLSITNSTPIKTQSSTLNSESTANIELTQKTNLIQSDGTQPREAAATASLPISSSIVVNSVMKASSAEEVDQAKATVLDNEPIEDGFILAQKMDLIQWTSKQHEFALISSQKPTKNTRLSVGVLAGMQFSTQAFESTVDDEYARFREQHHRSKPGSNMGIQTMLKLFPKWNLHANFQYTQYVHALQLSFFETQQIEENGVTSVLINTEGARIVETGQVKKTIQTYSIGTWYEFDHQVTADLSLSYKYLQKGRWSALIGGGVSSQLYATRTGQYITEEYTVEPVSTDENMVLRSKINPIAMTQLSYNLNKNISIGLHATYKPHSIQYWTDSNKMTTSYHTTSIGLSCMYGIY